jgi:hypothetical protein
MKEIKLNEKQKTQIAYCEKEYDRAVCIKQDADERFYTANKALWKKIMELFPEVTGARGTKYDTIDHSVKFPC